MTNCVAIEGDFSGSVLLVGPGAGSKPTASAVASDIIDVARGFVLPPFLRPVAQLKPFKRADLSGHYGSYYVRLSVLDRPGAMASIAKRMGDRGVSLESIVPKKPGTADSQAWPGARFVRTTGLGHRRILRDPEVIARAVAFIAS